MTKIDDGGAAFPVSETLRQDGERIIHAETGMSLRAYYAGQALPAAVEDYDRVTRCAGGFREPALPYATKAVGTREEIIARQAVKYADALIAALKTGGAK